MEGGGGCMISCDIVSIACGKMAKLEVLKLREEQNKVQDLPARGVRITEGEGLKGWRDVFKALFDIWHGTGCLEVVYPELLEAFKFGKVAEFELIGTFDGQACCRLGHDSEPRDEWKQTTLG